MAHSVSLFLLMFFVIEFYPWICITIVLSVLALVMFVRYENLQERKKQSFIRQKKREEEAKKREETAKMREQETLEN